MATIIQTTFLNGILIGILVEFAMVQLTIELVLVQVITWNRKDDKQSIT